MKKGFAAIVALVLAAVPAAAATPGSSNQALTKVDFVLNWVAGPQHTEVFVARDKGFFKRAGLEVNIHSPTQTTDAIKLVASGQDDMGMALFPDVIFARAQEVPVKVTSAFLDRQTDIGLLSRPEDKIRAPRDLIGKTVGLTPVPGNRARFFYMLDKNKIPRDKVKIVTVQFNGPQAVASKQVDAADAVSWFELGVYYEITKKWPSYMPMTKFGVPRGYFIGVIVGDRFANSNPAVVTKVTRAILQAQAWTLAHPKQARQVVQKAVRGVSPQFITQSRNILDKISTDAGTKAHGLGWMDAKVWKTMIDFAVEAELIEEKFAPADIFTNKFLGAPVKQPAARS
jgi:ABC-type nitrate/sulfonate/bicarbonate transport system substrate-binding protein